MGRAVEPIAWFQGTGKSVGGKEGERERGVEDVGRGTDQIGQTAKTQEATPSSSKQQHQKKRHAISLRRMGTRHAAIMLSHNVDQYVMLLRGTVMPCSRTGNHRVMLSY